MEAATSAERSFCTTCGWLLPAGAHASCAACGGDATPLPLVDNVRPLPRDDDDDAMLTSAKEAWAHAEHARALGLALTLGTPPRGFTSPHGPGWVVAVGSVPVFAMLEVASSHLTLEVPVVRLPQTKRVPALRAALALCNESGTASRFCLRLDLLVVRYTARLDLLSPGLIRKVAREIAACANRAQEQLTASFDARPAIPEQGVLSAWDRLGRPQPLPSLAAPSATLRPPSTRSSYPPPKSSSRPSSPSVLPGLPARAITLRLSIPPVLDDTIDDDLPAILSPGLADEVPSSSSRIEEPPATRPSLRPSMAPAMAPLIPPSMPASAMPNTPPFGLRLPSTGVMRAMAPSETDGPPSRRAARPPPLDSATPEGKLCELLRQALSLATVLSFEGKPQAMLLLVRAAVFRAVHEHYGSVPYAVSHLYRATRPVTREIWASKPDGRSGVAIPVAEPALAALEQIVAARGSLPHEKPVVIEPWTSAQQAKENLGKFVTEIELSPADPPLRHYLALGALSELLSRTRLPAATDQRLREIVAFAQRDGAKPHAVELMMTALRKIVSG